MNILLVFTLVILSVLIHPDLHQTDAALLKQHEFGANARLIGIDKSPSAKGFTGLCAYSNARQTSENSTDPDGGRYDVYTMSDETHLICNKEFSAYWGECWGWNTIERTSDWIRINSKMMNTSSVAEQQILHYISNSTTVYNINQDGNVVCSGTTTGKQSPSPSTVTLGSYSLRQKVLRVGQAMYELCDLNGCTELMFGKSFTSAQSVEAHSNLKKSVRVNDHCYWYNYNCSYDETESCHKMFLPDGSYFVGTHGVNCDDDSSAISQLILFGGYSMTYDSMTLRKSDDSTMTIELGSYCLSDATIGTTFKNVCGGTKEDADSHNQVNLGPFTLKRTLDQYQLCDFAGCKDL